MIYSEEGLGKYSKRNGSKAIKKRKSVKKKSNLINNIKHKTEINTDEETIDNNSEDLWKPIPGWSKYLASKDGRIKNFWTDKERKFQINNGYYTVHLSGDGEQIYYSVHRLIAVTFICNPDNLPEVDHIDGNTLNNNTNNLRWVTHAENMKGFSENYNNGVYESRRKILQYDKEGNLKKTWRSMSYLLKKNPDYRKGAIYYNLRKESEYTYGYKWETDPPIDKIKLANPNEDFENIGIYRKYDLSNYFISKGGNIKNKKGNLLKQKIKKNGYVSVSLYCLKTKRNIQISVHRLVAFKFVYNDDPENKFEVNHIDKDRAHNHFLNLEWISQQRNIVQAHGKMVKMIDKNSNKVIKIFRCVKDADRYLEVSTNSHIGEVCNGKWKTYKGYKWEWVKEGEILEMQITEVPFVSKKTKKKKMMNKLDIVDV